MLCSVLQYNVVYHSAIECSVQCVYFGFILSLPPPLSLTEWKTDQFGTFYGESRKLGKEWRIISKQGRDNVFSKENMNLQENTTG